MPHPTASVGANDKANYRRDIDGLRMIAVLAVIMFHFGFLPYGYLGVDVFFVISGFLITGIIHRECLEGRFTMAGFYLRRIRRILPLSLCIVGVALVFGVCWMLPDDLENLAQSVVATNFCANNILSILTTKNYWDVVNEFKPLMHTWSLGVEEQYYILYPFLVAPLARRGAKWLLGALSILALASFLLFSLVGAPPYQKFYLIQFRFWELAIGGIASVLIAGRVYRNSLVRGVAFLGLMALLALPLAGLSASSRLALCAIVTTTLLSVSSAPGGLVASILENRVAVGIGKISFSLYMWHQVVLAFGRYAWVQEMSAGSMVVLALLTIFLSVCSYYLIEIPFRNKRLIKTPVLLTSLGALLITTTVTGYGIYAKAGVLHDIPELGIFAKTAKRNMHAVYNDRVNKLPRTFNNDGRLRILVVGDSFARDWVNVLLESRFVPELEVVYCPSKPSDSNVQELIASADAVFVTWAGNFSTNSVMQYEVPPLKLWVVGTKSFGKSNGIFYNHHGSDYAGQRTTISAEIWDLNQEFRRDWGEHFIDYLGPVVDGQRRIPVFTPAGQFISQDCRHLTQAGAAYYAEILNDKLQRVFDQIRTPSGER